MTRHILLADNDELLRAVVGTALREAGYEVSLASNGLEALCRIEARRPDVLVLDLVMPKLDGARLCRHLKATARYRSLPVLLLTAAAAEAASRLEELGADGYLAKRDAPAMIQDLLRWLRAQAEGHTPPPVPPDDGQRARPIVHELLTEAAHLTAVLQNLGDGVLLLDTDGRVLFENRAGTAMLGLDEDQLLNVRLDARLDAPAGDEVRGALAELAASPGQRTVRLEIKHRDGVLRATITSLHEQGRLAGHVLLLQDMTALRHALEERTAELEKALAAKAEFLAKVSHELRTPLNFIVGFADLLGREVAGQLTAKQSRYLEHIRTGSQQLLHLVTDLLELSRADAGQGRLDLERFPVSGAAQEAFDLFAVQAGQKRLTCELRLEPELTVIADRRKFVQILVNLVGNAVKFTPDGGRITLSARRVGPAGEPAAGEAGVGPRGGRDNLPAGDAIEVSIADTGIGIAPGDLDRIFLGFQQAPDAAGDRPAGAGIGLALVRALAELHGGRVSAESDGRGRGARFVVRIPVLESPRPKRILVVEDEGPVLEALTTLLGGAGYAVEAAATGEAALAAIDAFVPDLVLLDLGLPDVYGLTVLRWLRGHPRTHSVPVLVLTGRSQAEAAAAVPEGANEFLTKPCSPTVLLRTVGSLLGTPPPVRPA